MATLYLAPVTAAQVFSEHVAFTPQPTPATSEAALDTLEHRLMEASGRNITLRVDGRELSGVFYAPLSLFWQVDEATGTVRGQAQITRTENHLYLGPIPAHTGEREHRPDVYLDSGGYPRQDVPTLSVVSGF